jgi:hypothetical protein
MVLVSALLSIPTAFYHPELLAMVAVFFSKYQIEYLIPENRQTYIDGRYPSKITGPDLLPDSNVEVFAMLLLSMENDVAGQSP